MPKILVSFAAALALGGCSLAFFSPPPVYVVFFPRQSAVLTANGKTIIDRAAAEANAQGGKSIQIAGPAAKIAPGYDGSLAEPRVEAVEIALIADGVAKSRLVRASETTDGMNVKSNPSGAQRVEIRLIDKPAP